MEVFVGKRIITILLAVMLGVNGAQMVAAKKQDVHSYVVAWDIDDVLLHNGKPCKSAFDIVTELHKKGTRQVLFSNKPQWRFDRLRKAYPAYFNTRYFDLSRSVIGGGMFEKKPYAPNYKTIRRYNKGDGMIFFDDKAKNIVAARHHGMEAYVWMPYCKQSAFHARSVLHQRNVL